MSSDIIIQPSTIPCITGNLSQEESLPAGGEGLAARLTSSLLGSGAMCLDERRCKTCEQQATYSTGRHLAQAMGRVWSHSLIQVSLLTSFCWYVYTESFDNVHDLPNRGNFLHVM